MTSTEFENTGGKRAIEEKIVTKFFVVSFIQRVGGIIRYNLFNRQNSNRKADAHPFGWSQPTLMALLSTTIS